MTHIDVDAAVERLREYVAFLTGPMYDARSVRSDVAAVLDDLAKARANALEWAGHAGESDAEVDIQTARAEAAEAERDEFKRLFGECHPIHLDGVLKAEAFARKLDAAEAKLALSVTTEYHDIVVNEAQRQIHELEGKISRIRDEVEYGSYALRERLVRLSLKEWSGS